MITCITGREFARIARRRKMHQLKMKMAMFAFLAACGLVGLILGVVMAASVGFNNMLIALLMAMGFLVYLALWRR